MCRAQGCTGMPCLLGRAGSRLLPAASLDGIVGHRGEKVDEIAIGIAEQDGAVSPGHEYWLLLPLPDDGPSQPHDKVADGGGAGEEWVVAGVEFHDAGCSTRELALKVGRRALVLNADEVCRGHVLPSR